MNIIGVEKMEFVREYLIHEVTYKYNAETEQETHKEHMVSKGFTVVPDSHLPFFMKKSLIVVYQKRQLNDGIPRL
jgi:hypothetical protein